MHTATMALQALVATSIFFVWVVRYVNIVEEFEHYRLPAWLRDLVGILKLSLALMLLLGTERAELAVVGGLGIAALMGCALLVHLRVKNPPPKMLPAASLLVLSLVIAYLNSASV
jgi:hypothetical protein